MQHDLATRSPLPPSQSAVQTYKRSSLRNTWALICLLVLSLYALAVLAHNVNDGFNPTTDAQVMSSFVRPDGKIIVGGSAIPRNDRLVGASIKQSTATLEPGTWYVVPGQ